MFSTTSTINVALTDTAALIQALVTDHHAVTAELREVRLLERVGELSADEARLLRQVAESRATPGPPAGAPCARQTGEHGGPRGLAWRPRRGPRDPR